MRILVYGAAGAVGTHVTAEALSRGHAVSAAVRRAPRLAALHPQASGVVADAARPDEVAALAAGHDVVIAATRPPDGQEAELVATAQALLHGVGTAGSRLLLVGGAATLTVPGSGGRLLVDDDNYCAAPYRAIARACAEQQAVCAAAADDVRWTYVSPPAMLVPGERSGRYRVGGDELLVDADGVSRITLADFAVALMDEVERPDPRHHRARFTVAEVGR